MCSRASHTLAPRLKRVPTLCAAHWRIATQATDTYLFIYLFIYLRFSCTTIELPTSARGAIGEGAFVEVARLEPLFRFARLG